MTCQNKKRGEDNMKNMKKRPERKIASLDEMLRIYGPRNKAERGEPSKIVMLCTANWGEIAGEKFTVVKKDKAIERLGKYYYKKNVRRALASIVKEKVFAEIKIGQDIFLVIPQLFDSGK